MKKYGLLLLITLLIFSCKNKQNLVKTNESLTTKPLVIYKTTGDYNNYVPVTMNIARTEIVSYPAPPDVFFEGKLAYPTPLKNGYLLDNRGINENTVFLKFTYEEYSKLKQAPSIQEMNQNILEKYPLMELIYCDQFSNSTIDINSINALIDSDFKNCKRINIIALKINNE